MRAGLAFLSEGRSTCHCVSFLSFQNILLLTKILGVLESVSIKCSQSYSIKCTCAFNSTSATEKCYSRNNTLKRQVQKSALAGFALHSLALLNASQGNVFKGPIFAIFLSKFSLNECCPRTGSISHLSASIWKRLRT